MNHENHQNLSYQFEQEQIEGEDEKSHYQSKLRIYLLNQNIEKSNIRIINRSNKIEKILYQYKERRKNKKMIYQSYEQEYKQLIQHKLETLKYTNHQIKINFMPNLQIPSITLPFWKQLKNKSQDISNNLLKVYAQYQNLLNQNRNKNNNQSNSIFEQSKVQEQSIINDEEEEKSISYIDNIYSQDCLENDLSFENSLNVNRKQQIQIETKNNLNDIDKKQYKSKIRNYYNLTNQMKIRKIGKIRNNQYENCLQRERSRDIVKENKMILQFL